jgi:hypothetical protein
MSSEMPPHLLDVGVVLFHKLDGEIVDYMAGFHGLSIHCEEYTVGIIGVKEGVHHTANQHPLSGSAHGIQVAQENVIKVDI